MTYIDTLNYDIYYDIRDMRIAGSLFEVDECLAEVISILNKKGYHTEYCCSGHLRKTRYNNLTELHDNLYITFSDKMRFKTINFPKDFEVEYSDYFDDRIIIRKYYKSEEGFERFKEIYETVEILYKWAISLL